MEPLLDAADRCDFEVVRSGIQKAQASGNAFLLNLVAAIDVEGNTLLHRWLQGSAESTADGEVASVRQESDGRMVQLLVAAGAPVNAVNVLGESPLVTAVRSSVRLDTVRMLLNASADLACADLLLGETALMEAACSGDIELCRLLLDSKANPMQRNRRGLSACDLAAEAGNSEMLGILRTEAGIVSEEAPAALSFKPGPRKLEASLDAAADESASKAKLSQEPGALGFAFASLTGPGQADRVAEELAKLEASSVAELESHLRKRGLPIDPRREHFILLGLVKEALLWDELPLEELASTCEKNGLALPKEGCRDRRAEMKRMLVASAWEDKGIPMKRLPGLKVAQNLLEQVELLFVKTKEELEAECKKLKLPPDHDDGQEKEDLMERVKMVMVWNELPMTELRKECAKRDVPVDGILDHRRAACRS